MVGVFYNQGGTLTVNLFEDRGTFYFSPTPTFYFRGGTFSWSRCTFLSELLRFLGHFLINMTFINHDFEGVGSAFFTIRRNFLIGFPFLFFHLLTFSSSPINIWLFDHSGGDFLDEDQGDFFNTRALLDKTLKFLFFANLF